jgi:hypothetical protein
MNRLLTLLLLLGAPLLAQIHKGAEDNAALRYWNAFAQMSDQKLADAQSKQLEAIVNGSSPWDESTFGKLLAENRGAIDTMLRGTTLPYCAWGIDYVLAEDAPIPQIGRGRALARLNVLTAERLASQAKSREATDHLIAGIRFARDLGEGMPLIGVLVGQSALTADLNASTSLARDGKLSTADKARLTSAVRALSPDTFDWGHSMQLEAAAMHSALVRLKNSDDPAKLLDTWSMPAEAKKDPRPTDADIQQVDEIMLEAEKLMRQPASTNRDAIAQLDAKAAKLKPVAADLIFSMRRINDHRREIEDLRQKFLQAM